MKGDKNVRGLCCYEENYECKRNEVSQPVVFKSSYNPDKSCEFNLIQSVKSRPHFLQTYLKHNQQRNITRAEVRCCGVIRFYEVQNIRHTKSCINHRSYNFKKSYKMLQEELINTWVCVSYCFVLCCRMLVHLCDRIWNFKKLRRNLSHQCKKKLVIKYKLGLLVFLPVVCSHVTISSSITAFGRQLSAHTNR